MSEERLREIVRDGLESLPLPDRFASPGKLVAARKARRRSLLMVAAAAACLVAALGFSPVGTAAMQVVSGWFVPAVEVRPLTAPAPEWMEQLRDLKPGDKFVAPPKIGMRQVYEAVIYADLAGHSPAWPLPQYLAPAPDAVVTLHTAYLNGDRPLRSLYVNYQVQLNGKAYTVFYSYGFHMEGPDGQTMKLPGSHVLSGDPATAKRESVIINGHEALAVSPDGGKVWTIPWVTDAGQGKVQSNLPLPELVRLVESIPNL